MRGCFQLLQLLEGAAGICGPPKVAVSPPHIGKYHKTHYHVTVLFMVIISKLNSIYEGVWQSQLNSSAFSLLKVTFWNSHFLMHICILSSDLWIGLCRIQVENTVIFR